MSKMIAVAGSTFVLLSLFTAADACELKAVGAGEFNKTCKVIIGYANGAKVGAFRLGGKKVGTCAGYLPYTSISHDTVVVGGTAFKLTADCASTNQHGNHVALPLPNK
ncbi:hypothetical protein [Oryzifoliimicrobium ureilyticus]|uniref:hypothetical protein n=1 Tax=Oryzifoliimicrobium ureilyticus TaxID=3113724 RepID=UPI0030764EA3